MKFEVVVILLAIVFAAINIYQEHFVAPKELKVQQEIYVNDHYAYLKPLNSELIEVFTNDGINVKICKGGLDKCQTVIMK